MQTIISAKDFRAAKLLSSPRKNPRLKQKTILLSETLLFTEQLRAKHTSTVLRANVSVSAIRARLPFARGAETMAVNI